jgi:hypothetical protein
MKITTTTDSSAAPAYVETGGTVVTPDDARQDVTKLVVAVHGVGDQYSYATLQSVVNQFCRHYQQPMDVPLGAFHNGRPVFSIEKGALDSPLMGFAFAEVYWARIPQELVADKHTLEEAKKWATTIVERLRTRWKRADQPIACGDADFALSRQILHEMIETIAVAERLCFIAEMGGLFTFDLRKILEDYLGDVQVVAEFGTERRKILQTFAETMEKAAIECPNAGIYIVAHSEGTVVALLGLLEAFGSPAPPSWTAHVRGFMTIGSPIDKHLYFWPELFRHALPVRKPPAPIAWRNYYDRGDPIGFELDAVRRWFDERDAGPQGVTWRDVFEFDEQHDFGFTRYPFPGKAHVDYWEDGDVFGHFIESVVAQDDRPDAGRAPDGTKASARPSPVPPKSRTWSWIVSWILPYVGVFLLLCTAAFIVDKAVLMASGDDAAGDLEIFRGTVGLATLLFGVTIAARIPRLTKSRLKQLGAVAAGALSVVLCLLSWGAFDSRAEDVVPLSSTMLIAASAAVIVLAWLFGTIRPAWGATPMILIGTAGVAVCAFKIIGTASEGPTWPLAVATVVFLYIWLLAALFFDLIVVWHLYIRSSLINKKIRDITTLKPRVAQNVRPSGDMRQTPQATGG